jgi:hypothetical protein
MAFLKIQKNKLKSGKTSVSISIVKSKRCEVTGVSKHQFLIHVGAYDSDLFALAMGRMAVKLAIKHACDRAFLDNRERAQVFDSFRRKILSAAS